MRHYIILGIVVFVSIMLINACENKVTESDNETFTVYGNVIDLDNNGVEETTLLLTGLNGEMTALSDSTGKYAFTGLQEGDYTLTVFKEGYTFAPQKRYISITNEDIEINDFVCQESNGIPLNISGKVTNSNGEPVNGVTIIFHYDDKLKSTDTYDKGSYNYSADLHQTYTIIPVKEGYEYTFVPDRYEITIDELSERVTSCNFTAEYSGPPLYSLFGRVIDTDGNGYSNYFVRLEGEGERILVRTDENGYFVFTSVKEGAYTVIPDISNHRFEPEEVTVTVSGEDAFIPDFTGSYNGPNQYHILGRVVDGNGNGIPDVTVGVYIKLNKYDLFRGQNTDSNGNYRDGKLVKETTIYTIEPRKEGYVFTPESSKVTLEWNEGIYDAGDKIIDDFVGSIAAKYSSP